MTLAHTRILRPLALMLICAMAFSACSDEPPAGPSNADVIAKRENATRSHEQLQFEVANFLRRIEAAQIELGNAESAYEHESQRFLKEEKERDLKKVRKKRDALLLARDHAERHIYGSLGWADYLAALADGDRLRDAGQAAEAIESYERAEAIMLGDFGGIERYVVIFGQLDHYREVHRTCRDAFAREATQPTSYIEGLEAWDQAVSALESGDHNTMAEAYPRAFRSLEKALKAKQVFIQAVQGLQKAKTPRELDAAISEPIDEAYQGVLKVLRSAAERRVLDLMLEVFETTKDGTELAKAAANFFGPNASTRFSEPAQLEQIESAVLKQSIVLLESAKDGEAVNAIGKIQLSALAARKREKHLGDAWFRLGSEALAIAKEQEEIERLADLPIGSSNKSPYKSLVQEAEVRIFDALLRALNKADEASKINELAGKTFPPRFRHAFDRSLEKAFERLDLFELQAYLDADELATYQPYSKSSKVKTALASYRVFLLDFAKRAAPYVAYFKAYERNKNGEVDHKAFDAWFDAIPKGSALLRSFIRDDKTTPSAHLDYLIGRLTLAEKAGSVNADLCRVHFTNASRHQHPLATLALGQYLQSRATKNKDWEEIESLYRRLADLGYAEGSYRLGKVFARDPKRMARAIEEFTKAAKAGFGEAQAELGAAYHHGTGVKVDHAKALSWYRKAMAKQSPRAMNGFGLMLEHGLGIEVNQKKALEYYRSAAEGNYSAAYTNIASCYYFGKAVKKNIEEALTWWRKAAEAGSASGQFAVGIFYDKGEIVNEDAKQAFEWYLKAAKQGYAPAEVKVAEAFRLGRGTVKNDEKARLWFQSAASKGSNEGAFEMGNTHRYGLGTKQDYPEAMKWYLLAAKTQHPGALNALGLMYRKGLGVEIDTEKAKDYYHAAANLDYAPAYYNLGIFWEYRGANKNYEKAREWYLKAALKDYASAFARLGAIYHRGLGTKADLQAAKKWYERGAKANDAEAKRGLAGMLLRGLGPIKQDKVRALKLYHEAAEGGSAAAQNSLGVLYRRGVDVKQDYKKAMAYYQAAADQGYRTALYNIGFLHEKGYGVKLDIALARKWYAKADAAGVSAATRALKRLDGE